MVVQAKTYRQRVGRWGEETAARYLEQRGYAVVARNARTPYGEIDLVARSAGGELVFVEVKTRTSARMGAPEEAVDRRKLDHMVASAQAYVEALLEAGADVPGWRIDALAVQGSPQDREEDVAIWHFENIAG